MLSCEGADIWRRLHISSSVIHKASTYGQHQRPSCYVYRSKATVCRRLPGVKRPSDDEPPRASRPESEGLLRCDPASMGAWIARGGRRFVMGAYPVKASCESFDCWFRLRRYGRRCADLPVIEKAAACFTRGLTQLRKKIRMNVPAIEEKAGRFSAGSDHTNGRAGERGNGMNCLPFLGLKSRIRAMGGFSMTINERSAGRKNGRAGKMKAGRAASRSRRAVSSSARSSARAPHGFSARSSPGCCARAP